jgi:SMP-30/gluconolaconase/LRE-like protein
MGRKAIVLLLALCVCACAAEQASVVVRGFPGVEGIAGDPQGVPFFGAGGKIMHILARNLTLPLADTGGHPAAMAFDRNGDLYVADPGRKAILKVTPWGAVRVAAGGLNAPAAIAVAQNGTIYFGDASGLYRLKEKPETLAVDLGGAKALAASTRRIFVSRGDAIWRVAPDGKTRAKFASFGAAAMALDEKGNLYTAREAKVSVLGPDGKIIETYELPGKRLTGLAFGGIDLNHLYVTEAETGSVYRLRALHRSQLLPWESDPPLAITEPADGAVLNHNDGEATAEGLRITVKGYSRVPGPVRINGASVPIAAGRFETQLVLRQPETKITAQAGAQRNTLTVLWDRNSFKRYRVSTDDNIFWLKDVGEHANTYQSIFENSYLSFWRDMHSKYGAKIHQNIYYETKGFNLSQMPAKFRSEWQRNADWIHLSFHARANDPDRPYVHASAEQIGNDYRAVMREIERFAGKEVISPVTTVHWGATTRAAMQALRKEGVRTLIGYFETRDELPSVCYYVPAAQSKYMMERDYWKDTKEDILFVRHDIVINTIPLAKIVPYLERIAADPHQSEIMELMIHEQYFYPDYRAYEPDYRQRVETAIKFVVDRGYKPVFYGEGFAGAQ